jgi:hypothetical protein
MSDVESDVKESLELSLELDQRAERSILSRDGQRMMGYQSLAHHLDNLINSHEVQAIVQYNGNQGWMYKFGLFRNPSLLAYRICSIFFNIRKDLPEQQEDILNFLFWLEDLFVPFLTRAEQFIPNVRDEVDQYLQEQNVPTVQSLVQMLQKHFLEKPAIILRCILATRTPLPPVMMHNIRVRFSKPLPVIGPTIAKLQGLHCEVSQAMARRCGMPIEKLELFFYNLENFSQIQGKSFYGSLLTMSVAKNFLIKRLTNGENSHGMFLLLMRILHLN